MESGETTRRSVLKGASASLGAVLIPAAAAAQPAAPGAPADFSTWETQLRSIAQARFPNDANLQEAYVLRGLAGLNTVTRNRNDLSFPSDRVGQFSKGLARGGTAADPALPDGGLHDALRGVLKSAYTRAPSPQPDDYEAIEKAFRSGNPPPGRKPHLRWTDPLGGLSHDLEGIDPAAGFIAPSPSFSGLTTAGEMVELYWLALLRDTSLRAFSTSTASLATPKDRQDVADAVDSLKATRAFGPDLTIDQAFRLSLVAPDGTRCGFRGVDKGPYVSQFLAWAEPGRETINFGSLRPSLRQASVPPGQDFLFDPNDRSATGWFNVQSGSSDAIGTFPPPPNLPLRYIQTVRDGANYAHFDKIYQEYLLAACIMLTKLPALGATFVEPAALDGTRLSELDIVARSANADPHANFVAEQGVSREDILNFGNPYFGSMSQVGFATFGVTHAVTILSEVSTRAHKACWYQKWLHGRLRPEEFGGRLQVREAAGYRVHSDIADFKWLELRKKYRPKLGSPDSYLLPMAYPEGCPTHPAYPSGHATVAGACVTALKAIFDETRLLVAPNPNPGGSGPIVRIPSKNGTTLIPLPGGPGLTVGGELNKLASNIAYFRTMSGVHWKSDGVQGVLLGEQVAISILVQQSQRSSNGSMYREHRPSPARPAFRFSMFSGQRIEIRNGQVFLFNSGFEGTSGTLGPQATWGDAIIPVELEDLFTRYQALPTYD